jgi:putative ABC transport system permease protein
MTARSSRAVAWAAPLLYGGATITLPGGGSEPLTLVGVAGPNWHGGPWNVVRGNVDALRYPDAMIFEDSEREKLGGLNLGSIREVNGYRVVAGAFTWGLLPFGPSLSFADYDFARLLLKVDRDQTHFVLIGLKPGIEPERAAAELQLRMRDVQVYTTGQFKRHILHYLFFKTPLGVTYGSSTLFGLIVGFVIVSLSMFSSVVDNLREFGTLKAIGATNSDLARLLLAQSLAYAILGSLIGLAIVTRVAEALRTPKLAILIPPIFMLGSLALMIGLCISASVLALLRIRKVEPAMVFR